jgi:FlaA1/EpsC-like NDP-sugar epimerase
MHTLSVGQATREKYRTISDASTALMRLVKRAGAFDESAFVLLAEILLAALSYTLAVFLLTQTRGTIWMIAVLRSTLAVAALCGLTASASVRLYSRPLRYASVLDLISIVKAVALSSILMGAFVWWQFPLLKIPAAVFVMDAALLQIFWVGLHFGGRMRRMQVAAGRKGGRRAVIVGAGDAGMSVLKELALDAGSPCRPVAVVDDDSEKWGRSLYGVPVLGGTKDLARIAAERGADEILICIPSATHPQMHDILDASRRSNLPIRSLPSLAELIQGINGGKASRRDLRSPRIEDILQRDEIPVDAEETRKIVGGKIVLVTGAGGSIGAELCRQIAAAGPRRLLLVDKSENSLFYVNLEACERLDASRVKPFLADLIDKDRITNILRDERPDIVFHAAAHKHVAMLELHPQEAIRNNVLGTRNIAEAALACGVGRFVNISTDKAVDPRNYMGLSKKITELCIQELAANLARDAENLEGTRFSSVRFGNVAGSTGSVLRLFWDRIQKGRPVHVTDARATRFFMSVPEAVHLILRAAALGKGGETFVFDMGEPLNIYELAKTMMLFAGIKPERDLAIEFIGLREGEKIDEELWEEWEHPVPTGSSRILVIREKNSRAAGTLTRIRKMEEYLVRTDGEGLLTYIQESFPDFRETRPNASILPAPPPPPEIAAMTSLGAA